MGALPYLLVGAAWGSYIAQDPAAFRDQMKAVLIIESGSFDYFAPIASHAWWAPETGSAGPLHQRIRLLPGVGFSKPFENSCVWRPI